MSYHISFSPEERARQREQVHQLVVQADYGMAVYQRFLQPYVNGPLRLGKSYISPLRAEKHPSFNLFRSERDQCVWWKDQASSGGDAVTFIMRLFNCDYRDAIRKLRAEVLGLPADADRLELMTNYLLSALPPPKPPKPEYPRYITPIVREHDFYRGPWAEEDEKYFPIALFGRDILHAYHCRPLNGYHYQQYSDNPKDVKDFRVSADWYIGQGMYSYWWLDPGHDGRHKIVRPYTPTHPKTGKKRKWLGNTKADHDLFGQHLLPEDGQPPHEAAILVAGNRDAMAFYRLTGVVALATTGEGHTPTEEQLRWLSRKAKRWYVLYDNDATGQKFQEKLAAFGFQATLSTPLVHYQKNDITQLLQERPLSQHPRLGQWFRHQMGLST